MLNFYTYFYIYTYSLKSLCCKSIFSNRFTKLKKFRNINSKSYNNRKLNENKHSQITFIIVQRPKRKRKPLISRYHVVFETLITYPNLLRNYYSHFPFSKIRRVLDISALLISRPPGQPYPLAKIKKKSVTSLWPSSSLTRLQKLIDPSLYPAGSTHCPYIPPTASIYPRDVATGTQPTHDSAIHTCTLYRSLLLPHSLYGKREKRPERCLPYTGLSVAVAAVAAVVRRGRRRRRRRTYSTSSASRVFRCAL